MSVYPATFHPSTRQAAALDADIITPDHARYDEARRAWDLAIDQQPAAMVFQESAQDVATAVQFARQHGLRVAPQGPATARRPLGSLEDTIPLKTERMRGVQIDPKAWLARVKAGAAWLEVVDAAAEHGLAALAGSSPDVGVVGYTLGGGMSFIGRKYGLAANAMRAVELVTADGRLVCCDRKHEPDLFWALRGGGGSLGVVTAIELELFPIEARVCRCAVLLDRARLRGAARLARAHLQRSAAGRAARRIKTTVDPDNLIRSNHPIRQLSEPLRAGWGAHV